MPVYYELLSGSSYFLSDKNMQLNSCFCHLPNTSLISSVQFNNSVYLNNTTHFYVKTTPNISLLSNPCYFI